MATAIVLVVLVLAAPAVYAADHTVGGSSGWTNFGTDYTTWSAGETFSVGDTLVFNYDGNTHGVSEVSQSDYNSCSSSNAIMTYNDGATTITLSKAGPMYFICPTAGHCSGGMKLAVNVGSASTTPTPGTSPSTPATTTPSGSTPSKSNGTASHPGYNGAAGSFSTGTSLLVLGSMLGVALMG
ncbi:hypothetical protein K2173_024853 [Erythroxylum novogranatense]|uniref:Phytocyanin domain-containing protein n=1 Tax=Erythroxylum novogranatense TaxID=1862640 RepID=A0AAV8UCR2_9ROSI|nr:hypothetical protein K2173_024853 [Erythroxylum novogranatense]